MSKKEKKALVILAFVVLCATSGCNMVRGLGQDLSGMYNGMRQSYDANTVPVGKTSQRMRELGWNDDGLLDHPSYGAP